MVNNKEKRKIIRLSQKSLTPTQRKIPSKVLKFIQRPQDRNVAEIKDDASEFCRRLRLA